MFLAVNSQEDDNLVMQSMLVLLAINTMINTIAVLSTVIVLIIVLIASI
jgi:hypothetical protein